MSKYTRGLLAVILAVVLVLPAAAFAMLPEANARSSTGMDGPAMTGKTVVDYDTSNHWKFWAGGYNGKEITTQNVGRIWTDKTVRAVENGDSDFLTTLSAISSTSDTTVSGKPLDIVLVLDASGSMKYDMVGAENRMAALKSAANGFIGAINTQNQSIADESKLHRVAIVKFAGKKTNKVGNDTYDGGTYNYSQVVSRLTVCRGDNATALQSKINDINYGGATQADFGMEFAQNLLNDGRADAKKVVVFFTDGSPTSSSGFEAEVANSAIRSAKNLKNKGTDIYAIGIFDGANPNDVPTEKRTSRENKFMHAVSSNYPDANSYKSDELGTRAENSDYYKSATSASELEKIFEEISGSIIQAGYPTEVHGGYGEHKSGYITFTDELGDFMQVDNFTSVVYNGTTFDKPTKKTEGNVDTYKFTGAAANLVITVQHAEKSKPRTGDIVTVKIPASLIPLRYFKITDGVLTVDDTEPIQVNYTSSVKKDALDNLFTPEQVVGLKDYIKSNTITAEDGSKTVNFYANKWNGGTLGDTIANFEPADSNRYYYFQKQTPIYVDKNCTTPATGSLAAEGIYYYKDEFEAKGTDSKVEPRTAIIEFTGGHAAQFEGAIVRDASGNLSFSEGTARLAFIDELHTTKELVGGNPTGTAADVLNPKWNNTSAKSDATEVDVHLGNNGKISFNVTPATVDTKTSFGLTKVLEGREWTDADKFKFELSATSENDAPMPAPATATVTKANLDDKGKAAINFGEITYNKPGEYTYEVREVKGDAGGITYSKNVATFKVTVAVKVTGGLKADVEKISGETEFKNTYSAKTETSLTLEATKKLTGRPMADDEFKFALSYAEHDEVLLDATNKGGKVEFGPLTYTTESLAKLVEEEKASFDDSSDKPTWTIRYTAAEQTGKLPAGVSAAVSAIDAYVTVVDNGDGTLTATADYGDAGNEFMNAYTAAPAEASLVGEKNLQVPDGLTPADITGKFTFTVTGEEGAPMPANASVTNDAKGKVDFGKITFTLDDLNKALGEKPEKREHTFTYTVTESGEVAGVTNDAKLSREVSFTVTDDSKGKLSVSRNPDGNAAFTFTNTYNVTPVETSVTDKIAATKVLTGRDMAEGEFSFELVEGEGKDAKVVATGKNAADGKITMSTIEYTKAGTHTYTLREVKGNAGGITYSDAKFTIETTITDNGDGTLSATHVLKDVKVAEFKNSYNVTPKSSSVTEQITADKVLDGRDLKAGEFRFELVEGNNVVSTGTNNADGKIVMDPVTYTAAGEHTYMLRETKAGATENGITYSTAAYTIVTIVKDNGDGTLSVEHKLQNAEKAIFENTYTVTPKSFSVTDQITATKYLTGRDLKEGEFSFELVEGNDVVATGKNDARGKITMSPIEYTAAGKHAYTLREVPGDAGNGITYDGKTYTIETTITDKGDGTLEAKHVLKGADEAKFSNSYKPNPDEFSVSDQITATKVLTGRDLKAGEFSFELVEGDKVVATGTNAADGKITMNAVKYTEAGKHTYTLREIKGGTTSKGITYSDAKYTIETTITDNGDGTLSATHVLKGTEPAEFKNSYSVTPLDAELDFDLSKAIDGREWTDGDEFSFTITAPDGAPLPDPATVTVSKHDAKDGIAAIKFGKIRYTAAGAYKYEIRENAGNTVGMTYDSHVATAEVTVTEDGDGNLTANATKKENGRFTNTYRTELNYTAAGGLWLSKYLDGRPMTEGQFTFTVTPADDASARALGLLPGANSFKSPEAAEATVGLIDILAGHEVKFTQADAGKTFKYTVAEKNDGQPGYTYDDAVRTVTIAIADDTAGTLTATTTVSGGPEGTHTTVHKSGENKVEKALVPFHNSYSATTNTPGGTAAQVVATKTLAGRPMADGEFWFGIAYQGELVAYENLKPNIGGHVSFDTLHYDTKMLANLEAAGLAYRTDKDGKLAWTINYTAYEDLFGLPNGVSATTWSFGFKVIVVDNGDGTLTATVDYGGVEPLFENAYGADAVDAALTGTKKLQVAEGLTPADITGKFTFTVTADEAGAPMPERTTVTNDAAGNVDFGKIHFTLEDLNRALGVTDDATDKAEADEADDVDADEAEADADADANADEPGDESEPAAPTAPRSHTFIYTVTESGSAPGVTNDASATRKVSYTVTDDGAGHLSVVRNGDDGAAFTFTNTYSVTPTDSVVTDQVKTVKRLTGRDLAAGEFTFDLLEDGVVVASGTNDVNGNVTLSPIRYEAPGTHTYTLREACPNALGLYKGVTYDGTTYTVVTTVSDNGDGTLTAAHKLEGATESAGFTNKYHAMPTQVSIGAIKVLEGRELKKDEFSFKLVGEDIESTVANDADGKISFDKFEYDEPGTHVYTISEVKGDEVGMTYDKSVFTVTVNVVDDGEGNLKANVAFTKGDKSVEGIVFNNTYKKPETPVPTPDPGTPKTVTNIVKTVKGFLPTTGDQQAAALLMTFVIAMAGVGALVWGIRKR
ncbi:Spy0128 family protein [Collinsella aerofaciens]|uniref:Spy0128 family protein n=1 Tax=Collinsella aerofaciens TaxID=74426 RepID=UPI0021B2D6AA|nr:FctA domain-containing protein [Collinsella aerofaciens]MCT6782874.1 VWA domain-containing protein [Collinsella aerofaciens]